MLRNPHEHSSASAERAADYLVEQARRVSGATLCQGTWDGPFAERAARLGERLSDDCAALKFLTRTRVRRVPRRAVSGLFAWAAGLSIELRTDVPSAGEVLALQASGRRCVSVLDEGVSPAPHESGLDFLIHDLCHLDKFVAPEHYEEQVGFFATLSECAENPRYLALEELLDPTFVEDRERLGSDVNGSAVYLFALLKMKLKMAARRRHARLERIPPPVSGALDAAEQKVFDELESVLYDALGFEAELRDAARATSSRRDAIAAASLIAAEFRERGRSVLSRRAAVG